jgi:GntP family permease
VIGTPMIALLAAVVLGLFTLGRPAGFTRERLSSVVESSPAPIAGVLLIVSAGGGFKQTLIDIGVGPMIVDFSEHWSIPALVLGWLIAVAIRLATGSATVATVSAAGLVAPLTAGMSTSHVALLVLAVGAGSLFFSHRERRRVLAGQGVLLADRRPDRQDLVGDGDDHFRRRLRPHPRPVADPLVRPGAIFRSTATRGPPAVA